jgi:hypothetical protein
MNVRTDSIIRVRDINSHPCDKIEEVELTKWRTFFYIQEIKDIALDGIEI